MHLSRHVKNTNDVNVAKFNNNTIYSCPSTDGVKAKFLHDFYNFSIISGMSFAVYQNLPAKSVSGDQKFKVGKLIEGHQEQENKFIKS